MKLCGFDVQPGHGGAKCAVREGLARHHYESCEL
jgi:hypothetical protein